MGLPEHLDSISWETDYYQLLAVEKSWKPWWYGWRLWPLVWMGDDEYFRRTLVVGPIVFPLWRCRCKDCRTLMQQRETPLATLGRDEGSPNISGRCNVP